VGGQSELNKSHQGLRAPVSGVVTATGGKDGIIAIRDANGFSHEILHTHARHVAVGDPVVEGQLIGRMGNTGVVSEDPKKEPHHHVHYQLRDLTGHRIDPAAFWDAQGSADPNPAPPALLQEYQEYLRAVDANSGDAGPMSPNMSAPFGTAGQFAPGSATSSRPLYETRSSVGSADGASTPARDNDFRYVSRRTPDQLQTTYGDVMAPMFPPNEIPADASASFAGRFGDWVSLPEVDAARTPQQPRQQEQAARPLGIFSGKPMPDYPFPPPIWGFPDDLRGIGKEDWGLWRLKPADWKKAR